MIVRLKQWSKRFHHWHASNDICGTERLFVVRSLFTSRGFTYFTMFNGDVEGFLVMDLTSGIWVEVDVVMVHLEFEDRWF